MTPLNPVCRIDTVCFPSFSPVQVDVLRLDRLHPIVSGNKWFKLNHYLAAAKMQQKTILTFGGAFSNHIVATAAAAQLAHLPSIGIIRGEKPGVLSPTLQAATKFGMQLYYTSRHDYKEKTIPEAVYRRTPANQLYIIPEGGYGIKGKEGAGEILKKHPTSSYSHIICAAGTGTTLAGLTAAATEKQQVIGISVLKNNTSLQTETEMLLPPEKKKTFTLLHEYHFGGYAKYKPELIGFMNDFFRETGIPTDFVYTGKAFWAAFDLLAKNKLSKDDSLLLIHTGGLQGNVSLPKGTLIYG